MTVLLLLLSGAISPAAGDAPASAPVVVLATALAAQPPALSTGAAGPLNRYAFEVRGFSAQDPRAQVLCLYETRLVYRCRGEREIIDAAGGERIVVTIPDLDLGTHVRVRFINSHGQADFPIDLTNLPQVVHEIEALPLLNGGRVVTGSDGRPAASRDIATERATATPAMARSSLGAEPGCDQIRAEWVRASATDPLFTGEFGAAQGSVVITRPVVAGSAVRPDNLPQWTLSYPSGANRVQFIAHYEVIYRVGLCADRVAASD